MPRTVEIAIPADKTNELIGAVKKLKGLIGLKVQRGISLKPEGDILSVAITNRDFSSLMQLLSSRHLVDDPSVSISSSKPLSIISKSSEATITTDTSETTWEEIQANINSDSEMTLNGMLLMFLAGLMAVVGITTNALHLVIGAMVVAPGFEPITRISLGLVTQHADWKRGVVDTLKAYAALFAGAVFTSLVMILMGENLESGESSYLPAGVLVSYWTNITDTSIFITIAASVAGALVLITNRSVLTLGVMIGLALIPSAAITGMALVVGNWHTAGNAFFRLLVETGIVVSISALIFLWKKYSTQRKMMYR